MEHVTPGPREIASLEDAMTASSGDSDAIIYCQREDG
jgi:hypothetical protein